MRNLIILGPYSVSLNFGNSHIGIRSRLLGTIGTIEGLAAIALLGCPGSFLYGGTFGESMARRRDHVNASGSISFSKLSEGPLCQGPVDQKIGGHTPYPTTLPTTCIWTINPVEGHLVLIAYCRPHEVHAPKPGVI